MELNSVFFLFFFLNFNYSLFLQKLTHNIWVIQEFYKTVVSLSNYKVPEGWKNMTKGKKNACINFLPCIHLLCLHFIVPTTGRHLPATEEEAGRKEMGLPRVVHVIVAPTKTPLFMSLLPPYNTTQSCPTADALYCVTVSNKHRFIWKMINTNKAVSPA